MVTRTQYAILTITILAAAANCAIIGRWLAIGTDAMLALPLF